MWRLARSGDDAEITTMCQGLYAEDPSPMQVTVEQTRTTLHLLRSEPARGAAVVLEMEGELAGYALLISYWSNELGGEIVVVDELFVKPAFRNKGYARALFAALKSGQPLRPGKAVALELEVTPQNERAARLYGAIGFAPAKNRRMRLLL